MPEAHPYSDQPAPLGDQTSASQPDLSDDAGQRAESERLNEAFDVLRAGGPEPLPELAYERLLARLRTMPVIEQAKGILMAQSRCTADEAFAMLRAASQRSNMKVRDLAEEIVSRVSSGRPAVPPQSAADD